MRQGILALLALIIVSAATVVELRQHWATPLNIPATGFGLTIAAGDSLRTVVKTLHQAQVVKYPQLLLWYGRWTGLDQQVKRGEYNLPPGTTAQSLLGLLQSGDVIQYQVTLPEGITLHRALAILWQQEQLSRELEGINDPRIVTITKPAKLAEGLFFPDSYRYQRGDSDWDILQRAFGAMQDILATQWQQREPELPYANVYEALIMASIVERETGLASEREAIAGVFVRRLQKRMLLQTDPTVMYGLGAEFDGNLRRSHLGDAGNLFNTYRHRGLPPSPIALPGRAAIHAALHPAAGNALYFVARGDGSHEFSATLAEHNRAVRKYQLKRRSDYRSAPARQE